MHTGDYHDWECVAEEKRYIPNSTLNGFRSLFCRISESREQLMRLCLEFSLKSSRRDGFCSHVPGPPCGETHHSANREIMLHKMKRLDTCFLTATSLPHSALDGSRSLPGGELGRFHHQQEHRDVLGSPAVQVYTRFMLPIL